MLYYSHEARQSAITDINKCIHSLYETTDETLDFNTVTNIVCRLKDLRKVIITEDEQYK